MGTFTNRTKNFSTDLETNPVCQATPKKRLAWDFCLFVFAHPALYWARKEYPYKFQSHYKSPPTSKPSSYVSSWQYKVPPVNI